jgi:hypothetical protein
MVFRKLSMARLSGGSMRSSYFCLSRSLSSITLLTDRQNGSAGTVQTAHWA